MNPSAPADTPRPRRRRALRRALLALALAPPVATGLLMLPPLSPAPLEMLYLALPDDVHIAADAENVYREFDSRTADPRLADLLVRLGLVEERDDLRQPGLLATLFWFTGRHTVAGAILPPTVIPPTPFAEPTVDYGAVHLCGATTVGWRYRLFQLAELFGWVPGLGTLRRDPATGAQTLLFYNPDPVLDELGLVLSLELRDGILYACLSRDADGALELVRRVAEADTTRLAPVFGPRMMPQDLMPRPDDGDAPLLRVWASGETLDGEFGLERVGDSRIDVLSLPPDDTHLRWHGTFRTPKGWYVLWNAVAAAAGVSVKREPERTVLEVAISQLADRTRSLAATLRSVARSHDFAALKDIRDCDLQDAANTLDFLSALGRLKVEAAPTQVDVLLLR